MEEIYQPFETADELERRVYRQGRALVALARLESGLDPRGVFQRIDEVVAETLGVQRASVWLYSEDRCAICCADLFEREPGRHSEGGLLEKDVFPAYFAALEEERTIAAHDVREDERVREFLEPYLAPLGISSMLDAPVRAGGRTLGVLCCEHIGPMRRWTFDEQHFAGAVGDLVALAIESSERRRAREALARQAEDLERRLRPAVLQMAESCRALLQALDDALARRSEGV